MNKINKIIGVICMLTAVAVTNNAFARGCGPCGPGGGGCRPGSFVGPGGWRGPGGCRPCGPGWGGGCRPCDGDWWGRGGRNFWPGFIAGAATSLIAGSAVGGYGYGGYYGGGVVAAVPQTVVVQQPTTVVTAPATTVVAPQPVGYVNGSIGVGNVPPSLGWNGNGRPVQVTTGNPVDGGRVQVIYQ